MPNKECLNKFNDIFKHDNGMEAGDQMFFNHLAEDFEFDTFRIGIFSYFVRNDYMSEDKEEKPTEESVLLSLPSFQIKIVESRWCTEKLKRKRKQMVIETLTLLGCRLPWPMIYDQIIPSPYQQNYINIKNRIKYLHALLGMHIQQCHFTSKEEDDPIITVQEGGDYILIEQVIEDFEISIEKPYQPANRHFRPYQPGLYKYQLARSMLRAYLHSDRKQKKFFQQFQTQESQENKVDYQLFQIQIKIFLQRWHTEKIKRIRKNMEIENLKIKRSIFDTMYILIQ